MSTPLTIETGPEVEAVAACHDKTRQMSVCFLLLDHHDTGVRAIQWFQSTCSCRCALKEEPYEAQSLYAEAPSRAKSVGVSPLHQRAPSLSRALMSLTPISLVGQQPPERTHTQQQQQMQMQQVHQMQQAVYWPIFEAQSFETGVSGPALVSVPTPAVQSFTEHSSQLAARGFSFSGTPRTPFARGCVSRGLEKDADAAPAMPFLLDDHLAGVSDPFVVRVPLHSPNITPVYSYFTCFLLSTVHSDCKS